jgi:two-component system chemotaxis response regulator CheB
MLATQRDRDDSQPKAPEVRVLLAEDSATIRHYLTSILHELPGIRVIGEARDGEQAVTLVARLRPDVVSMDINMPNVDGLEATRRIMAECPTPVVVVSGLVERDLDLAFQALQAGALAVVERPPGRDDPSFAEKQRQLVKTLIAMANVSVVRRGRGTSRLGGEEGPEASPPRRATSRLTRPQIIAIGASAGGPSALSLLLGQLPAALDVPIVVVQHIPHEFLEGLARWLSKVGKLPVQVCADRAMLRPGVVHLSPGTAHLTIAREQGQLVARLNPEQGSHRYMPSVDVLFESIADVCGAAAVGVVMTGMGEDGASGLLKMRQAGARTLAQDKTSSTVYGMPAAAADRGAAEQVLPLSGLGSAILKLL